MVELMARLLTFAVVAGATGARLTPEGFRRCLVANLIADGIDGRTGRTYGPNSEQQLMEKKGESIADEPSPAVNGVTTYALSSS